ncbi:hypothetical protein ACET3X_003572 [Alternaria dauci]|uniref:NAD(P)-binding protein n=1 Tax=Alternaria dauci TaxID=48095 RepID=A0ABR3UTY1_9PLEO
MAHKILLFLGAGMNVGTSSLALFRSQGYKIAAVARTIKPNVKAYADMVLTADFSDPRVMEPIFEKVKQELGVPNVVVYNPYSWSLGPVPSNPVSAPLQDFQRDLAINTVSAYAAAQAAVRGFGELPEEVKKTFIYTGNSGPTHITPEFLMLGLGKSSSWYLIQTLVATPSFASKGYRFYYVDERTPDGKAMHHISGPGHAEFFLELAENEGQKEPMATFVLVLGATSGIGWALAEKIVADGKHAIVVGRRQEKLDEFQKKHGSDKVSTVAFDITKLEEIPSFVKDVTSKHPDLDSVFLNSGIQRGFDFSKPETVDLDVLEMEFRTNYLSYMHLTTAFIPFLQKQDKETSLIYTTSGLALLPLPRCPNYCASKAALHHMILVLRHQLANGPGNIKVIEIFPPAVQTELHDAKHQPDIKDGGNIGMPLSEFTDEAWKGLVEGKDQIPVGFVGKAFDAFENKRQEMYKQVFLSQL